MKHMTIKDLPEGERPYEKLQFLGPGALSDAELLAIILKSGTKDERSVEIAQRLLKISSKGLGGFFDLSLKEMQEVKGIGIVKAVQIKAVAELSKRMARYESGDKLKLNSPESIASYYKNEFKYLQYEKFMVMFQDIKGGVIKESDVFSGSVTKLNVHIGEIFKDALKQSASFIVLLHNHPSGDPTPSKEDIDITEKLKSAAEILEIELRDHIIIGSNSYISLREALLL